MYPRKTSLKHEGATTGGADASAQPSVRIPAGHQVLVIDNFATGKREVLPAVDGLEVVEGSIVDGALVRIFRSPSPHVIHSAAAYKEPDNWLEDITPTVHGPWVRAPNANVEQLIYFQTALCYGRPETVPIPVDAPTRPFTSYGTSKLAGEHYVAMATCWPC